MDIAVWENFTHKPDLIHLFRWQREGHQASSWLLASSKRLSPMGRSLMFFMLVEASVLLKRARHVGGPGTPRAVPQPSRCTGRPGHPARKVRPDGQVVPALSSLRTAFSWKQKPKPPLSSVWFCQVSPQSIELSSSCPDPGVNVYVTIQINLELRVLQSGLAPTTLKKTCPSTSSSPARM